jgi:hypothetical protein
LLAAGYGIIRTQRSRRESLKNDLVGSWTNEGDIHSTETNFVDLELTLDDGVLSGTLTASGYESTLDAHVEVGWRSARLRLSHFKGKTAFPFAEVELQLRRNPRNIHWKVLSGDGGVWLPHKTVLWLKS